MDDLRRVPGASLPDDVPLADLSAAGVKGLALCVLGDPNTFLPIEADAYRVVLEQLEVAKKKAVEAKGVVVLDPAQLETAASEGTLAFLLGIEGGDFLEGDLGRLDAVFGLGARLLGLVHYSKNCLGSISFGWGGKTVPESERTGLSEFGKSVVERANDLGMIIDLAHADDETIRGALDRSASPMICSHTGPRALQDFPRYIPDELIRRIADAGGLIGLWTYFHDGKGVPDLRTFAEYAAYCADLAGPGSIAIGSDFNGVPGNMAGYANIFDSPKVIQAFSDRGFSDREIAGMAGLNFLRYYKGLRI
jgi:membrane dipeptidase